MSFADDFKTMVGPRLNRAIAAQAFLLAADDDASYSDAMSAILDLARRYGASFLPGPLGEVLQEQIASALLKEIVRAEARVETLRAEIKAERAIDPVRHYEALAAASDDPDRMRWTFASISPEYRAFLLARRREGKCADASR